MIFAPHVRPDIASTIPHTKRTIEAQIATSGQNSTLLGVYTPHQGSQRDNHRDGFWEELGDIIGNHTKTSPLYVLGDLSIRLFGRRQEEQHAIGQYIFVVSA